jgi:hypothetical protein
MGLWLSHCDLGTVTAAYPAKTDEYTGVNLLNNDVHVC